MPQVTLFVTGLLAEKALELALSEPRRQGLPCLVLVLPISVAALMTTNWLRDRLASALASLTEPPCRIILPGRAHCDAEGLTRELGVAVQKGPSDLWELPQWLGCALPQEDASGSAVVISEIVEAWRMSPQQVLEQGLALVAKGADFVDLGGNPAGELPELTAKVKCLRGSGIAVSVDVLSPPLLREAALAGASLLLSLDSSGVDELGEVPCPVVVIPDADSDDPVASLKENLQEARRRGLDVVADPLLAPPLGGFAASLARYVEFRAEDADTPLLMGTGNVSELLEADSRGVNALLAAAAAEIGADYLLTTEVAGWTRNSTRQLKEACRIMAIARSRGCPPKRISQALRSLPAAELRGYSLAELRAMQKLVRDRNWRFFVAEGLIVAFNCDAFICERTAEAVFASLGALEPSHAFYAGRELERASTSRACGLPYVQDQELDWGIFDDI